MAAESVEDFPPGGTVKYVGNIFLREKIKKDIERINVSVFVNTSVLDRVSVTFK